MASRDLSCNARCNQRGNQTFTAEEVAQICARNDGDEESDLDSSVGGISSGEECDLQQELNETSDSNSEAR